MKGHNTAPLMKRPLSWAARERVYSLLAALDEEQFGKLLSTPREYVSQTAPRPSQVEEAEDFAYRYAAVRAFKKCAGLPTGIDTKAVAIRAEREVEERCLATNIRLRSGTCPDTNVALHSVARALGRILGSARPELEFLAFGPGRTDVASGKEKTKVHKFCADLTTTASNRDAAMILLKAAPLWLRAHGEARHPATSSIPEANTSIVDGNWMLTVPKDATTDRVIRYEPSLNQVTQTVYGRWIRNRLRRKAGIEIQSAQVVHKKLALLASKYGTVDTLDLKSASAHITNALMLEVLPIDVFEALDNCRSRYVHWSDSPKGSRPTFTQGFCSMGNGFTFELQTLLFYSICQSILDEDPDVGPCCSLARVYGDDMIVPSKDTEAVVRRLELLGFVLNRAKSAIGRDERFRESCGTDAVDGVNVTPPYIRKTPDLVEDAVRAHNRMYEFLLRREPGRPRYERLKLAVIALRNQLKTDHVELMLGSAEHGDGHLYAPFDEAVPTVEPTWFFGKYRFKTLVETPHQGSLSELRKAGFHPTFGYAAMCASLTNSSESSVEAQMVRKMEFRKIWVGVTTWADVI